MAKPRLAILLLTATLTPLHAFQATNRAVTITRDDWGIAHISGKTDADAVFGMIYAQAEDDFNRVETNYLDSLGRLAEAEGESKVMQDLRQKLFMDPAALQRQFRESPAWLQALMTAWADGLNFYLASHPQVKPRVLTHFEPWMALSFTEGSIGGDIERINLSRLEAFYGKRTRSQAAATLPSNTYAEGRWFQEPTGSNGIAIAPSNTRNKHALLLINPHTSFFFRSELQMTSTEGLNAYGAVTWGQFFIYQGFNEKAGWMHTSSGVDAVDEYLETVEKRGDQYVYKFGSEMRPVQSSQIKVPYRTATGTLAEKTFTVYRTHHGPIIRETSDGKWVAIQLMHLPIKALTQSYTRTKATNYRQYRQTMELQANSSNNTIFADAEGNIAYFHGNYIPRRDTSFDWTQPVDGSNPATDYKGLLAVSELPQLLNPKSGWLYNANNWPWSAAGPDSPKREQFPAYVETGLESARGLHAIRVLENQKDFTLDSLIAVAYDSYLPWFEKTIPALLKAWDTANEPLKTQLAPQIAALRSWNYRWAADSIPTALAVFWGEELRRQTGNLTTRRGAQPLEDRIAKGEVEAPTLLNALSAATARLQTDFGNWQTPWGNINRYQRINGDIVQPFNDAAPSIPVAFTSAQWGSLASFGARAYPGTKRWYGTSGNSFVAAVEFGDKVRAKAVTAGGESGHLGNKHFNDQAERYSTGNLREVYFYPSQLKGHTERVYHPGE